MQLPVAPMVVEFRMLREVAFARMLHHQPAVGEQQVVLEHVVNDFLGVGQVVRRIGENDVELLPTRCRIGEGVLPDDRHLVVVLQLVDGLLDELGAQRTLVHGQDRNSAPGGELVGDVAGAGEKVEHPHAIQVEVVVQDVEEAFFAHVHGGTHRQVGGRDDVPAPVLSTDNSHNYRIMGFKL